MERRGSDILEVEVKQMDEERKPWTVRLVCRDDRIVKIEQVKENKIVEGTFSVCTGNETWIFPLNNLIYAKLEEEDS